MKQLAQTFKALSDPIRLRIVLLLQAEGELCVCDLMAVLKLPQSTVSRHLAYLKRSCWLEGRREGVWMYYKLCQKGCRLCDELLDLLKRHDGESRVPADDRKRLAEFQKQKTKECG